MFFTKGKVLITGGAGFIGSHTADALIKAGYKVCIVDDLSNGDEKNLNPKAKFYKIDIRSEKLSDVFRQESPEFVFHFANQSKLSEAIDKPVTDAEINILGLLNVLENCLRYKVKRIVYASDGTLLHSDADDVPTPENGSIFLAHPLAISLYAAENYLQYYFQHFGLEYCVLRYANVYGTRQKPDRGIIANFIDKIVHDKPVTIHGDGHQTRDFLHVSDVVRANELVLNSPAIGIYNIGTGRQTTINELFALIKKIMEVEGEARFVSAPFGTRSSALSWQKAFQDFAWEPRVGLAEGIDRFIKTLKHESTRTREH